MVGYLIIAVVILAAAAVVAGVFKEELFYEKSYKGNLYFDGDKVLGYVLITLFGTLLWPLVVGIGLVAAAVGLPVYGLYRLGIHLRSEINKENNDA